MDFLIVCTLYFELDSHEHHDNIVHVHLYKDVPNLLSDLYT